MRFTALFTTLVLTSGGTLPAQIIGTEDFSYEDGPIADRNGGTGFNVDLFDGAVTDTTSDWDVLFGDPVVEAQSLKTSNSGAKREYNGPIEGAGGGANDGQDDHERSGAVRATGRVFYRFTMTRTAGTTWGGASSYDFGTERVFFGVPGTNGPTTGGLEFGCAVSGGSDYHSGIPADEGTHTIVTVLDFEHRFVGIWVDPASNDFYNPEDGSHSADAGGVYNGTNWSTAIRLASGGSGTTTWDDLVVALDPESVGLKSEDPNDNDGDGLPASWEEFHGLDDNDDGSVGESSPGAKDGPNGALGDPDGDSLTNLEEFELGTSPMSPDTDNDFVDDGEEKQYGTNPLSEDTDLDELTDFEEIHVYGTDPVLADGDGGGTNDFTEIALGTDPNDPSDDPATAGNTELIGMEFFDSYADGPIGGHSEGLGWDYDNSKSDEPFIGHTTLHSSWTVTAGTPSVQSGWLITQDSAARRAFHGGSANPAAAVGERSGSFREDSAAVGLNGSDVLYVKTTIVRQTGATWSGLSLFDFGTERIFLGTLSVNSPESGVREFGIEQSSGAVRAFSGIAPEPGVAYTLVGRFDFAASRVDLWIDPDLSQPEANSPVSVSLDITPTQMSGTGLRLGSGGSGPTAWDNLVAGTTWESLSSQPSDTDGDGMPDDFENLHGFDNNTNDADDDADGDGLTNLEEYLAGTNPRGTDSDGDGLSDGDEVHVHGTDPKRVDTDEDGLPDGFEVTELGTDPTLADTDGDGQTDGGEVFGYEGNTSDPLDPHDTVGVPLKLIGTEGFSYPDGPVEGRSGGAYFDYDNWLLNGPFIGHTSTTSDWDGTASVSGGKLVTRDTFAYREFNGPGEGEGSNQAPTDARMGAINIDGNHAATVVYFKATMTRRPGAETSVFGPDDFNQERLAFGVVNDEGNLRWGIRVGAGISTDEGAFAVPTDETVTVVGKLDFVGKLLSLWVDPDLAADEESNPALVTRVYLGTNWASGVRFASTGAGDTEWDDVVVATAWEELAAQQAPAPLSFALGIQGYDPVAGVIRLTASGIPDDAVFHLRKSTDLQTFVPLEPAFDFDSTTPQPFVIPVDPAVVPNLFFRAEEGPSSP